MSSVLEWLERRKAKKRLRELDDFAPTIGWPTCEKCGHAAALNPNCQECLDSALRFAELGRHAGISCAEATEALGVLARVGYEPDEPHP